LVTPQKMFGGKKGGDHSFVKECGGPPPPPPLETVS